MTHAMQAGGDGLDNLAWAVNGDRNIHSMEYTRAVYERLKAGQLKDGADGVREALHKMREILENGDTFWNPGDY